jgi:hypothetical protein
MPRGTDSTPEQLDQASDFLSQAGWRESDEGISKVSRGDICRLLAWYGALRYVAATQGAGTLEKPGRLVKPQKPLEHTEAPSTIGEFELVLTDLIFYDHP